MSKQATPFSEAVEDMIEKSRQTNPLHDEDYIGADGLYYCHNCREPKQMAVPELDGKIVPRLCRCRRENAEQQERERQQEQLHKKSEELRQKAFIYPYMREWDFSHDDRKNPRLSNALQRYTEQFAEYYRDGIGILFYGTVGTGKSYFAACVANAVINQGKSAYMTNFSRILNEMQSNPERQVYIDKLCKYDLLVLDDLGMERDSSYALEQVYNVIDSRCHTKKPMIITTNLALKEMTECPNIERRRIYDRIMERCHPIQVTGDSRRMMSARMRHQEIKAALGL